MFNNTTIKSLAEDMQALGISVKAKNQETLHEDTKGAEDKPLAEAVKLKRKRRGSKARVAKRKARKYYRAHKGSLKRKARRFKRSSHGKRFMRKYKSALTRFRGKVPKGKRIQVSDKDVELANMIIEGYEGLIKMSEVADTAQKIEDGIARMYEHIESLLEEIGAITEEDMEDEEDEEEKEAEKEAKKEAEEDEGEDEDEEDEDEDEEEDVEESKSSETIDALGEDFGNAMTEFDGLVERLATELNGFEENMDGLDEDKASEGLKRASKLFREAYDMYVEVVS